MNSVFQFDFKKGELNLSTLEDLARQNAYCMILDSHGHSDSYSKYEYLLAWGKHDLFKAQGDDPLKELETFRKANPQWLFGHLSFDLKNKIEDLHSRHSDEMEWSDLQFFVPTNVAYCEGGQWKMESREFANIEELKKRLKGNAPKPDKKSLDFKAQTELRDYLQDIHSLKEELQFGNIYEINYCTLLEARGEMEPFKRYLHLNQKHQAPFGGFYRDNERYLLCFSPERYLCKRGSKLISQPIKGTAPRSKDPIRDQEQKAHLLSSEKERAENVMIVDLVRNDLSRTAQKNSVSVPELFGLYSFNAVHQMISTVSSELDESRFSAEDALRYSFPMGSMTGAPKLSALQLIDKHEHFRRGLYSGSIGYFDPVGDFDFNVVIRSIQYHSQKEYAQVAVGSAITIHCDAEAEYAECLLKAEKLIR